MPNTLIIPNSGTIFFSNDTAGASTTPSLTGQAVSLAHDGQAGLVVSSLNTATSATNRFRVNGANGALLAVTDEITGTVFSVNDPAGLPIISADTGLNDVITMGTFGSNALVVRNDRVGVGTSNPNTSSALEINSTTRGFLPPRMTISQRNAISGPSGGLTVYTTDGFNMSYHNGTSWGDVFSSHPASFTSATLAAAVSDETGTGSLVFAENATLTNPTLAGQVELPNQAPSTPNSAATRTMAEDSLIWASRVRVHAARASGSTSFGGVLFENTGNSVLLTLPVNANGLTRTFLASNIVGSTFSGSSTNWWIPWQIRIPFATIISDPNSIFRVWTGSPGGSVGLPYSNADSIPIGMASIGFEFRANPASINQHQIRLIARDGNSRFAGSYSVTNGSPIVSGLSTAAVNAIEAELAAGRSVFAMSGQISNVTPDSKAFADGALIISASGTTVTLDRNSVTTNGSVPIRFVFASEIGVLGTSSWVNIGLNNASLNKQYDTIIENLGNGTANLYAVSWDANSQAPPLHNRVPVATLSTGVPSTFRSVAVNAQSLEAHLIGNGVNNAPSSTSNNTVIFNVTTKIG